MVAAAAPSAAPQVEVQALAGPQPSPESPTTEAVVTPASLVTQEVAAPVPPPAEIDARRGYGFLNVSSGADTAARLSGENVSSMFVMTKPIPADAAAPEPSEQAMTTAAVQSGEPVPAPAPKPKAVKPVATATAAKPAPKTATTPKPAGQAAPAPQRRRKPHRPMAMRRTPRPAETAEAAMVEPVPLTRRQRRLLRKQQEQAQDPFSALVAVAPLRRLKPLLRSAGVSGRAADGSRADQDFASARSSFFDSLPTMVLGS